MRNQRWGEERRKQTVRNRRLEDQENKKEGKGVGGGKMKEWSRV